MAPRLNLIAIGDATKDVFVNIKEAKLSCVLDTDICQLCLNYADKIPVESVVQIPAAGNAANAAIGTCRLGHHSALVTVLGDDLEGKMLYKALACTHINRKYISFDKTCGTNYSTILNYQGERTILLYHQPRKYHFPKNLPSAQWVYYTSIGKGHQAYEKDLLKYLTVHHKTKLLFNPGTHQLRRGAKSLSRVLKRSEILIINKEEGMLLLEESESHPIPSLLKRLARLGPKIVVITDGGKGSWAFDGDAVWFIPIFPGAAKERTGAGDAYGSGFVNALIADKDIPEAMRWGNAESWNVVRYVGPQEGLLCRDHLHKILKRFSSIKAKMVDLSEKT